jgi:hypothetical protein
VPVTTTGEQLITEVDYRAFAARAILAVADAAHIWVATDTGMILKLAGE